MPTIRDIMTSEVLTVLPSASVLEALTLVVDRGVSGLPVVDASRRIVGVVTEKDLLELFYEDRETVGDLMTPDPVSVGVEEPLHEVVDIMMTHDFRRVLIHDGGGRLVGLISRADVMPAILEVLRDRRAAG